MSRTSHRDHSLSALKKEQQRYFDEIKDKLPDNLPNNITELQKLLKNLLNNIFITSFDISQQSATKFNISDTTKQYVNIYTIPDTQDTLDTDKYIEFLKFMIQNLYENNIEFVNNDPNVKIITAYCINDKDKDEIEKIKKRYEELYLSTHRISQKKYPYWVEDLLSKSRNVLYKESETKLGINNIVEQDDNDFIDTLKKRISGIESCSKDKKEKEKKNTRRQEYFTKEYVLENSILPNGYTTKDKSPIEIKKKIKELCTSITWGTQSYIYKEDNKFQFHEFYEFITKHTNEINFVKTFLPSSCFDDNGYLKSKDALKLEIFDLVSKNDRIHRQYIFGIKDDVEEFINHKQFYEIYSMNDGSSYNLPGSSYNCNYLANWTIFLNILYSKCATYNNDYDDVNHINFPIRFILPDTYQNLLFKQEERDSDVSSSDEGSNDEFIYDKNHYKFNKKKFISKDDDDIRSIKTFSNIFNNNN